MTELCEQLADSFDVHVVCGQPNSPTDDAFVREGIEVRNGVTIHRVNHTCFSKQAQVGRFINLVSFTRAASRYLRHEVLNPDIIVSETDPFLLPLVAKSHARRTGAGLVCYLQDIYPDVAEAIGKVRTGSLTRRIRDRLSSVYRDADRVVVLGDCMRRRLESQPWAIGGETIRTIPNWADCELIRPADTDHNSFRLREGLQDKKIERFRSALATLGSPLDRITTELDQTRLAFVKSSSQTWQSACRSASRHAIASAWLSKPITKSSA